MAATISSFTRRLDAEQVAAAMEDVARVVMREMEISNVEVALRQPVTLAAAFADLAGMLGIAPPPAVRLAIS